MTVLVQPALNSLTMKTFPLHIAIFWFIATPVPCVHTSEPFRPDRFLSPLLKTLHPAIQLSVQTGAQESN